MSRKPKFKPVITRVKLNPEQAVLTCNCFSGGWQFAFDGYNRPGGNWFQATYCTGKGASGFGWISDFSGPGGTGRFVTAASGSS